MKTARNFDALGCNTIGIPEDFWCYFSLLNYKRVFSRNCSMSIVQIAAKCNSYVTCSMFKILKILFISVCFKTHLHTLRWRKCYYVPRDWATPSLYTIYLFLLTLCMDNWQLGVRITMHGLCFN